MTDDPAASWDEAYEGDPPWDTGEPQPAFVALAEAGEIEGRVLDAGCGTGTLACYLAGRGHDVTGVDVSPVGVDRARRKARDRGVDATFRVADALDLDPALGPLDTVVDSGLFHAFQPADRPAYADSLAGVVARKGRAFVLGFAEGAPDDWGPTPIPDDGFAAAFRDGWRVRDVREAEFETAGGVVPAFLAVVERV